jgi:hemerythrin-like domain-containing protein
MNFANRVAQIMHDEHSATIELLERLEKTIGRFGAGALPSSADPAVAKLLADMSVEFKGALGRHFDFEEAELFQYLDAAGDAELGRHLAEEHVGIRRTAAALLDVVAEIRRQNFDAGRWNDFRRLGLELCESLSNHARREDGALLPVLEDNMGEATAERLYLGYLEMV